MITLPVFLSFLLVFTGALGTGSVLSIGDGDTISIKDSINRITVRLACIDAPETSQFPYGMEAREKLWGLLPIGAQVTLKIKATDRYGRTVAEVLKGTTNINQAMVATGAAFVYWQYIEGCDRETYSRLENEARLKSLGVWAVPSGIQRPWDYRRGRKSGSGFNSQSNSASKPGYSGSRYRCKQIGNWAKAQELLKQGHSYLDGDGDGEACEGLR
ncbi:thermonuclease family protein [Synechococcus sp. UW140]|uniref:thermonuclease family protein n=1 Tax=Synechococcus sp. UW140 TaxID=368503 RepID=UPI0025ED106A|nr:thermonuclease family protein [Synechococcus sp. UW140]